MSDRPTLLWFAYDHSMIAPGIQLAARREAAVVLNPDSGPGKKKDPLYAKCARNKHWAEVYGYVDALTQDAKPRRKKQKELDAEVKAYREMYGVTHIWLDDVALFIDGKQAPVVRLECDSVIYNPGDKVPSAHPLSKEQLVCDFEDPITPHNRERWRENGSSVRVVFTPGDGIAALEKQALHAGVDMLGFEDISRHKRGEYQTPMDWIQKLM